MSPSLVFAPELLLMAQDIRVVFLDVDGVLTDGGLYFSDHGEAFKRFDTLDGHGIRLLQSIGITVVVVSGRDSPALRLRLSALGIEHIHGNVTDKGSVAQHTLDTLHLDWPEAAAMGDDWPDLPVMRRCALACAPANAHLEVRALAHYVTQARGGAGAVRELCDLLLVASGRYARLLADGTSSVP